MIEYPKIQALWEDYPGKLRIRSDGTTEGTTVAVLDDNLHERELQGAALDIAARRADEATYSTAGAPEPPSLDG